MEKQNICNFNFNHSGDLHCARFVYEKNAKQSVPSTSKSNGLHLVTRGDGIFCCNGTKHKIHESSLFFVRRGDVFSISSADTIEYCYICFEGRRGDEFMDRIGASDVIRIFDALPNITEFWLHCIESANKDNVDLISESVLLYTLSFLRPTESKQNDLLSTMISVTNENFSDPEFNLLTLASKIGYDDKYISSVFKKQKKITYSQYLRELRIRHAIFLIEQGIVSVKNIAILSGFGDPLYFSKVFKESEGVPPKEYIKNINEIKSSTDKE